MTDPMDLDPAAVQVAIEAAKTAAWAKCSLAGHEDIGQCWQECNDIEAAVLAAMPLIVRATADAIADKIEATRRHSASDHFYDTKLDDAVNIARSFGRTPETETTEATE